MMEKNAYATEYPDEGCGGLCVRSLECPYPVCILDHPSMAQRVKREARDEAMRAARDETGASVKELALRFEVREWTVKRALALRHHSARPALDTSTGRT